MELFSLVKARLIKRYKRFLADVILESGEQVTVHCPNTGAMTGCAEPGSKVWLSTSDNPKRKYSNTWELVQTPENYMACIHSAKANDLVKEAIEAGVIKELQGYDSIRTEVKYGKEKSRIDLLLERDAQQCYIEVKSVTLLLDGSLGVFPDAVSDRGRKHLRELIEMVQQGHRAVLFFCVQHTGIKRVAPADAIDQKYGDTFREAIAAGVEVLAYQADISPDLICLHRPLPILPRQP
ncbi:MAG: DNA/RNA nuclease SfsA [Oceanicoccus sp.]|uniref:DNA/RNA nuclease SfsA n=1 Tax=Oceanicoccus sp. TaxID=2691044 RepID=UPI00261587F8|nr:DNA/RNA nuclease SfsA [Oceanicoccus sp.]MDG1772573.1 DNA/RNA nuclease SfsA [Oceanicoccus sp.]